MDDISRFTQFQLIIVIAKYGQGSKVLKTAKEAGVRGGTVIYGRGTYHQPILEFLELTSVQKEIVWLIVSHDMLHNVIKELDAKFKFAKPNHGILFVTPLAAFFGFGDYNFKRFEESGGDHMTKYNAIMTIIDKGNAEEVVEAANLAGAKGATIINARGSGVHETTKLFNMEVETEKEIVLIIAKSESVKDIVAIIKDKFHIDEPGKGIIFVQEVHQTLGIR